MVTRDADEWGKAKPSTPVIERPQAGRNKGKTYRKREPAIPSHDWTPWILKGTWQKLRSLRSWVAIGVYESLAERQASRKTCKAKRSEIAFENGCSERMVQYAYKKLAEEGLIEQVSRGHQGSISEFSVSGYRHHRVKPRESRPE